VKCTDDGKFTLTLTASDGTKESSDLILSNMPPSSLRITSPLNGTTYQVGSTVSAVGSFLDAGANDKHTCLWTWNVGQTPPVTSPGSVIEGGGSGRCSGSHVFTTPGTYSINFTVTDDDLGSATSPSISIVVKPK
jgi:PKD repeat protein